MGGSHIINYQNHKYSRRTNGLQLPLNYLQLFGWIVFLGTGLLNLIFFIEIQSKQVKLAAWIVYIFLYCFHIVTHVIATGLDPSEEELRSRETTEVPEFDRNLHPHVIENGRCHLCNIYTSDKKTKHCGICNKCVYKFDHHCKWLNNCVGGRNYSAFIWCVITALFISILTLSLCVVDVVIFFENPLSFGYPVSYPINCTTTNSVFDLQNCKGSVFFIIFLIIYLVCSLVITCALLHLLCFHVYITLLGISTYEYIMNNKRSPLELQCSHNFCLSGDKKDKTQTDVIKNEPNVTNLVRIIINYELEKAKQLFNYNKNKIHPTQVRANNLLEGRFHSQTDSLAMS